MRQIAPIALAWFILILSSGGNQAYAGGDPVFVGAGDIAACGYAGAAETAALIDKIPGTVFTAGDNVYPDGTMAEYLQCFEPTWGRFKPRLHVIPGDHDYHFA